ncbi:hypothetical protein BAY61_27515 [Prauserella marina]|uniref:DNA-binding transcriptional regulator, AcrR family n=1 Tax=Prauserella marina TaxID=530584 RepID=A0A222VW52_9PSEU|nr:ScbR family autoregulator-binding transcription factor [Prauserella marina]ASR38137.1 hypothetical protein BAY61_27515 [Prauserella marina]PWV78700.1 TetR family transcriptional regulator [Prauserella marina]SDC91786.1 DNA-binding transcriptional regulator, AcrR family [Prauserella marina]
MARQLRAEVTRNMILRAAADAFDQYGYGGTSLSDVLRYAGVTKGALYFHFTSKEQLANAIVECQQAWSVAPAKENFDRGAPGLESVVLLSVHWAVGLTEDPMLRASIRLSLETGMFSRPDSDPYREWLEETAKLLRRAADSGELRRGIDPEVLARFVVGAFTGVQAVSQILSGRMDLTRRVGEMWELLLPSLVDGERLPYYLALVDTEGTRRRQEPAAQR